LRTVEEQVNLQFEAQRSEITAKLRPKTISASSRPKSLSPWFWPLTF